MISTSFATEEDGKFNTYHFCSKEHLAEFAKRKGFKIDKD
jgi:YHS domain-containing protein